jgi:glucosamine--fructose-6-phosphate aminotransferase (isomerizing)
MPVVVIAPKQGHYDKIVSNIQEINPEVEKLR